MTATRARWECGIIHTHVTPTYRREGVAGCRKLILVTFKAAGIEDSGSNWGIGIGVGIGVGV